MQDEINGLEAELEEYKSRLEEMEQLESVRFNKKQREIEEQYSQELEDLKE